MDCCGKIFETEISLVMKYKLYIAVAFILLQVLYSCENKDAFVQYEDTDGIVELSLHAMTQQGEIDETDPDYEIKSLRILAFQLGTKRLKFNSGKLNVISGSSPVTFQILTGTYDFVFIANEHSAENDALTQHLDQWTGDDKTLSMLDEETFPYNAFSANKNIPATSVYKNVSITGNRELTYPDPVGGTTITVGGSNNVWEVVVTRLAIRIDLDLLAASDIADKITEIRFANLPDKVPFFETSITRNSTIYYENGYDITYPLSNIPISDFTKSGPNEEGKFTYTINRLILPASVFSEKENADKSIAIHVLTTGTQDNYIGVFGRAMPTDYTSPRNTYYQITGILQNNFQFLDIVPLPWDDIHVSGNTGEKKLNVERLSVNLSVNQSVRIHFWSDQPSVTVDKTGYYDAYNGNEFETGSLLKKLVGDDTSNLHYNAASGSSYIDLQLNDGVTVSTLTSTILCIYLNASGLRREIKLFIK